MFLRTHVQFLRGGSGNKEFKVLFVLHRRVVFHPLRCPAHLARDCQFLVDRQLGQRRRAEELAAGVIEDLFRIQLERVSLWCG